jgi:GNAT superfamily N-acetyltransferase
LHAVAKAVANSLVVGVFEPGGAQVAFARMVTDYASFGYLADVFVLESHRGLRLGHAMVEALLARPDIAHCRNLLLLTRDAHRIYADCGFQQVEDPAPFMQIRRPGCYPPPEA